MNIGFKTQFKLVAGGRERWVDGKPIFASRVEAEMYGESLKRIFDSVGSYRTESNGLQPTHRFRDESLLPLAIEEGDNHGDA